jgi:hypothetical protein
MQSVFFQRQSSEVGRQNAHRMDRRTDIMSESGKSQFSRTRSATDLAVTFENQNRGATLGKFNCRSESVWPRSYDDHIWIAHLALDDSG